MDVYVSKFSGILKSGNFVVTAEMTPPKGVDIRKNLDDLEALQVVDAVNVTDQNASVMRLGPVSLCRILKEKGVEPICQFTCRDRNRIALQSDLLSAYVLGVENILCLTGDPAGTGDHPDAKPVFDLSVMDLIRAAKTLESGTDMSGNKMQGTPSFCLGAAVNPGAPIEKEVSRMKEKVQAGVEFFQTQAIYDTYRFREFVDAARPLEVPILAGIVVLKSGNMARYLNGSVPGITVPQSLIDELDNAQDKAQKGIEIAARLIRDVQDLCQGVHIMPIGWEKRVPEIMRAAGLKTEASPKEAGKGEQAI